MKTVKLLFTGPNSIGGSLISKFTWSNVSHVAIQVGYDVYEADYKAGVTKVRRDLWERTPVYEYEFQVKNIEEVKARLDAEVGKGYDFLAILCYPFRCDYNDKKRWICSELVAYAIQEYIPHTNFQRMAPRHLKLLGYALGKHYVS